MGRASLLTVGNPKTSKGAKLGYHTAVLHLAPASASGRNVCPMAELAGCIAGCLNTAGRGGIAKDSATFDANGQTLPDNAIQRCRIRRTRFFFDMPKSFMAQLVRDIEAHVRQSEKLGLTPVIRPNGTSDVNWMRVPCSRNGVEYPHIFAAFPDVQFYDYTKVPNRLRAELPANYYLCLSYSEASPRYAELVMDAAIKHNASMIMVCRDEEAKARMMANCPARRNPVDGDEHDLRFLDKPGSWVFLKAKGAARKDTSGFVLD